MATIEPTGIVGSNPSVPGMRIITSYELSIKFQVSCLDHFNKSSYRGVEDKMIGLMEENQRLQFEKQVMRFICQVIDPGLVS